MENRYYGKMSEKEIENLCKEVCSKLQDEEHPTDGLKSLKFLRIICGLRTCACPALTPSQSLNCILKVENLSEAVLNLSTGLAIIKNYDSLGLESHCNKALERILIHTTSSGPSEEKNKFLRELWDCPGLMNFPITSIEDLINYESCFLEEDILDVFEESIKTSPCDTPAIKTSKYERIILWCSNSARIFCAVTSIFNVLLQRTACTFSHNIFGKSIVSQFICNVKLKCLGDGKDFVMLYPREYHSLISVLDINPTFFPDSSEVRSSVSIATAVKLIKASLASKPVQTLCLLTHFPAWVTYVNR